MNFDEFDQIFERVLDGGKYPETPSRYIFFTLPATAWLICLDIFRPILLILLYLRIRSPYFYFAAARVAPALSNDLDMSYINVDTGRFSHLTFSIFGEDRTGVEEG